MLYTCIHVYMHTVENGTDGGLVLELLYVQDPDSPLPEDYDLWEREPQWKGQLLYYIYSYTISLSLALFMSSTATSCPNGSWDYGTQCISTGHMSIHTMCCVQWLVKTCQF